MRAFVARHLEVTRAHGAATPIGLFHQFDEAPLDTPAQYLAHRLAKHIAQAERALVRGIDVFEAQLQMACDFQLPALLHVRRSHAQVIATLKRYRPMRAGIIHAFAGSYEEAREYIKLGFRLGLGGAATWPQAVRLRRTVARLPLDSVVLETDAPDMAPVMHPGVRNSPEHLPDIAHSLAESMGVPVEQLAEASTRNACELFGWQALG